MLEAGEDRDCLQLMILDDTIYEGVEDLTGNLEGIVNQLGQLVRNPARITFQPMMTTIQINDNDGKVAQPAILVDATVSQMIRTDLVILCVQELRLVSRKRPIMPVNQMV